MQYRKFINIEKAAKTDNVISDNFTFQVALSLTSIISWEGVGNGKGIVSIIIGKAKYCDIIVKSVHHYINNYIY